MARRSKPFHWPGSNRRIRGLAITPAKRRSDSTVAKFDPRMVGNGRGAKLYSSSNWDFAGAQNNYLNDFGGICAADAADAYEIADVADALSRGGGATKLCKYKGVSGVSGGGRLAEPAYFHRRDPRSAAADRRRRLLELNCQPRGSCRWQREPPPSIEPGA